MTQVSEQLAETVKLPLAARATLVAVAALSLVMLPFSRHIVGPQPAFLPIVMSIVLLLDLLSAYLLADRFRDTGDPRVLWTAVAYLWSAVIIVGYSLTFPGLLSDPAPLAGWPSSTPWLYLLWHIGFPGLLGAAWYPARRAALVPDPQRVRALTRSLGVASAAALCIVAVVILWGRSILPVLIVGTDTTRMTLIGGPPGLVIGIISAVVVGRGTRRRTGPERWATVAVWVCVADLVLTFVSLHRYSAGWYTGRGLTVLTASLVFFAMMAEFTALQRSLIRERTRLFDQARTDDLTGLANRLALREELSRRLDGQTGDVLVLVDLDRFKAVNDSLGHEAGDAVLAETARRLQASAGDEGFVVRLGGDEFALLLRRPVDEAELTARMDAVLTAICAAYDLRVAGSQARVHVGASLGLTRLADHASPSEVLREADLALFRAKEGGRGRMEAYDDGLRTEALHRLELETEIRTGLDTGRLVPFAQPIVDLRTGAVVGHELLLRVEQGADLATLPIGLIEVAEDCGLITEIDTKMLLAAAELVDRPPDGFTIVAVNLSPRTLMHPRLADVVDAVTSRLGNVAGRIAIEVTESVLLADVEGATLALDVLRDAGFLVGLDDFGTGYSSLTYLRRFPLDFLKIDRSFITDIASRPDAEALCMSVIDLARALNLEVIAEGVETAEQADLLSTMGCTMAQGFHFGRPARLPVAPPADSRVDVPPAGRARRLRPSARQPDVMPPPAGGAVAVSAGRPQHRWVNRRAPMVRFDGDEFAAGHGSDRLSRLHR